MIDKSPNDCPVERLANDVRSLVRASGLAEEAAAKADAACSPEHLEWRERVGLDGNDEEQLFTDRLDAIQELAVNLRATSPAGALFQAMLCLNLLDDPLGGTLDCGDRQGARRYVEQLKRALDSIIGVLETCSGVSCSDLDDGYFVASGSFPLSAAEKYLVADKAA
jgi:hypothetical protein